MNANDTCPKCSDPITADDLFCNNCGHRLKADEKTKNPLPTTAAGASKDRLIGIILLILLFALIFGVKAWLDSRGYRAPWNHPKAAPTR